MSAPAPAPDGAQGGNAYYARLAPDEIQEIKAGLATGWRPWWRKAGLKPLSDLSLQAQSDLSEWRAVRDCDIEGVSARLAAKQARTDRPAIAPLSEARGKPPEPFFAGVGIRA